MLPTQNSTYKNSKCYYVLGFLTPTDMHNCEIIFLAVCSTRERGAYGKDFTIKYLPVDKNGEENLYKIIFLCVFPCLFASTVNANSLSFLLRHR